ncbi:MAG: hypothetical protein ABIH26_02765 [Candidatus Eisenbacteria bacterium]
MRFPLSLTWLLVWILAAAVAAPVEAASSRLRPEPGSKSMRISVGGKRSTYHVATREAPLEFRVHGPGPVRVCTRYLYPGEDKAAPIEYRVRLEIDGVELRTLEEVAAPDVRARAADGNPVGSFEKEAVLIPSGSHRLRIFPAEAGSAVAVRLFKGYGTPKKIAWVSFAPESYARALRLHAKESETIYYRFDVDKPVAFRIYGPLTVRVMTRLDFGLERASSQLYTIKVLVDGDLLASVPMKSKASHTSSYPDLPEITPGVARTFEFDVPKGKHQVQITLDCTSARSAALRILIPRRAVRNGG